MSISQWWKDKDHPREIATVKAQYKQASSICNRFVNTSGMMNLGLISQDSRRFDAQSSEAEVGESLATHNLDISMMIAIIFYGLD